jgi:hypothetical protein
VATHTVRLTIVVDGPTASQKDLAGVPSPCSNLSRPERIIQLG